MRLQSCYAHSPTQSRHDLRSCTKLRVLLACSYNQALPTAEDYAKEPPPPPAHLQLTLLNVPPAMDAAASLPRPQHVILNHIYCQRATHQVRTC